MLDMEESELENRIGELENTEIPSIQSEYNALLQSFLDAGGFPSPALHKELDDAKELYMKKLSELEDLKKMLFYMGISE